MIDLDALSDGIAQLITPLITRLDAAEKELAELKAAPAPLSVVGALIDRDGSLILTYSNGEAKSLGPVVGRNGDRGADGFGFDDMSFSLDDAGRPIAVFARGSEVKSFALPCVNYQGIWRADAKYQTGDAVTWAGSLWIAKAASEGEKPDDAARWQLAVKRGRDGKGV